MDTKPNIAFVCVHNSCRSQIAEAFGKEFASDVFVSYSAGTEPGTEINSDAVRLMREKYGIDMTIGQFPKKFDTLPHVDIVITMGCNVGCPYVACSYREDWNLEDPSGKDDETFLRVIGEIRENIDSLAKRIKENRIFS